MAGRNGNRLDPLAGIVPNLGALGRATAGGQVSAQLVHDPGNMQALVRLHDAQLFLEACRRYRPDAAVPGDAINGSMYESFSAAATEVLDDLAAFGDAVGAWNIARSEAAAAVEPVADGAS